MNGGTRFNTADHRCLTLWATACAAAVLPRFEAVRPDDARPREAVTQVRAWIRGHAPLTATRQAALDAHAAARETDDGPARAAARTAAHAAATAYIAGHAPAAAQYAFLAAIANGDTPDEIRQWQRDRLPLHLQFLTVEQPR